MHRYLRLLSPFERVQSLLEKSLCSIRYCLGSDEVVHSHERALEETDAAISGLVDSFGSILNPGYVMCDRLSLAVNHLVSIVHQATNDESVRNDGDKNRNNPIDTMGSEATTKAGDIIANVEELEFILTKHRIVDNAEKSLKELLDILKRKKSNDSDRNDIYDDIEKSLVEHDHNADIIEPNEVGFNKRSSDGVVSKLLLYK